MIRFFRSIRQKLLQENRFTRYLIYAIGEIVLVMIGILLAVQINDWNEGRKVANASMTHLQKMIIELETTKARMEYLTSNRDKKYTFGYPALDEAILNCDSLLAISYNGITKEDLPFLLNSKFFGGLSSLNIQQDDFEEVKNAGALNSLGSKELVTAIKLYYARVIRESGYTEDCNDQISEAIHKLENGIGKLWVDHKMNATHFDTNDYPWLFDRTSREYQDMQIGVYNANRLQKENREKMLVIYELSESLIQKIEDELLTGSK